MQIVEFNLFVCGYYELDPLMHDEGVKILLCMIFLPCLAHEDACYLLNRDSIIKHPLNTHYLTS